MTEYEASQRVAAKLLGRHYVGQRVRFGWPYNDTGVITQINDDRTMHAKLDHRPVDHQPVHVLGSEASPV